MPIICNFYVERSGHELEKYTETRTGVAVTFSDGKPYKTAVPNDIKHGRAMAAKRYLGRVMTNAPQRRRLIDDYFNGQANL